MSDRLCFPAHLFSLSGSDGELVSVRIFVEPRLLEELLDALAEIPFPINPRIEHSVPNTVVDFPAYDGRLSEVRETLYRHGFPGDAITIHGILSPIA